MQPISYWHLMCSQLAGKLFNVRVEAADGQAPVWHKDVRFFKVFLDDKPKAYFFLDPYSRPAGDSSPPFPHWAPNASSCFIMPYLLLPFWDCVVTFIILLLPRIECGGCKMNQNWLLCKVCMYTIWLWLDNTYEFWFVKTCQTYLLSKTQHSCISELLSCLLCCIEGLSWSCCDVEKRGGAWMDEVCGQSKLFAEPGETVRLPVAHMVCNQTPPIGDKPSLMTFRYHRLFLVIFQNLIWSWDHTITFPLTRHLHDLGSSEDIWVWKYELCLLLYHLEALLSQYVCNTMPRRSFAS